MAETPDAALKRLLGRPFYLPQPTDEELRGATFRKLHQIATRTTGDDNDR